MFKKIDEPIEGVIRNKRDLGDVILFLLEAIPSDIFLIARSNVAESQHFQRLKSISVDDFCRFETKPDGKRLAITHLISHIPQKKPPIWRKQQKETLRAYSYILHLLRDYLYLRGYVEARLPGIHCGMSSEDDFPLNFFGQTARLSSSNALYLDIYAIQLQKVFCLQKTFRAEPMQTPRHLSEFDMLELAVMNRTLEGSIDEAERMIKHVLEQFSTSPFSRLSPLDFSRLWETPFDRVPYRELDRRYQLNGAPPDAIEIEIAQNGPVFIIHLPRCAATWTARWIGTDLARSFVLMLPGVGECAEGAEKQTDMDLFLKKIESIGLQRQLEWYPRMIPYSRFPLSNMGLGVERLAMWILGRNNIRLINPFYRDHTFAEIL